MRVKQRLERGKVFNSPDCVYILINGVAALTVSIVVFKFSPVCDESTGRVSFVIVTLIE